MHHWYTEIGRNFFPANNDGIQVLESFAVFAGAFFMRPIGGALFGYIGDKYGRVTSLRISLFMMAIPTFLTGCLSFSVPRVTQFEMEDPSWRLKYKIIKCKHTTIKCLL